MLPLDELDPDRPEEELELLLEEDEVLWEEPLFDEEVTELLPSDEVEELLLLPDKDEEAWEKAPREELPSLAFPLREVSPRSGQRIVLSLDE